MMNVIKNKKIILLSTIAICLLIACIVLGATIKSYKKNNKETVKETSKPTTTQTEKATTQDKTISDNDKVKEYETESFDFSLAFVVSSSFNLSL